jgi:hypothetical protein
MPFTYTIDPARNLVRQTLWDVVTVADLREMTLAVRRDPHYRRRLDILADLRDATVDISHDDMIEFSRFLAVGSEIGRQAIVVRGQLEFGIARMFEQLTELEVVRADIKVFLDLESAEHWLANPAAPLRRSPADRLKF